MKWGIREAIDVYFKAKSNFKLGARTMRAGEPVLIFDTVKTSTLEVTSEMSYITGGKGNSRLLSYEGDKAMTFQFEDALLSNEGLAILAGADLIPARNKNLPGASAEARSVISHYTEKYSVTTGNMVDSDAYNVYQDDTSLYPASGLHQGYDYSPRGGIENVWLTKKPFVGQNASIYVMLLDDAGEMSGAPVQINLSNPSQSDEEGYSISNAYLCKFKTENKFVAFGADGRPMLRVPYSGLPNNDIYPDPIDGLYYKTNVSYYLGPVPITDLNEPNAPSPEISTNQKMYIDLIKARYPQVNNGTDAESIDLRKAYNMDADNGWGEDGGEPSADATATPNYTKTVFWSKKSVGVSTSLDRRITRSGQSLGRVVTSTPMYKKIILTYTELKQKDDHRHSVKVDDNDNTVISTYYNKAYALTNIRAFYTTVKNNDVTSSTELGEIGVTRAGTVIRYEPWIKVDVEDYFLGSSVQEIEDRNNASTYHVFNAAKVEDNAAAGKFYGRVKNQKGDLVGISRTASFRNIVVPNDGDDVTAKSAYVQDTGTAKLFTFDSGSFIPKYNEGFADGAYTDEKKKDDCDEVLPTYTFVPTVSNDQDALTYFVGAINLDADEAFRYRFLDSDLITSDLTVMGAGQWQRFGWLGQTNGRYYRISINGQKDENDDIKTSITEDNAGLDSTITRTVTTAELISANTNYNVTTPEEANAIFDDMVSYYVDIDSARRNWVTAWCPKADIDKYYTRQITAQNYGVSWGEGGNYSYLLAPAGGIAQPRCFKEGSSFVYKVNVPSILYQDIVLLDYYVEYQHDATQISILPDKFSPYMYVEGSSLVRRASDGVDLPIEFVIPKLKITTALNFTLQATGDASTFTFQGDAYPDFSKFDLTRKVLADIQILDADDNYDLTAGDGSGDPTSYRRYRYNDDTDGEYLWKDRSIEEHSNIDYSDTGDYVPDHGGPATLSPGDGLIDTGVRSVPTTGAEISADSDAIVRGAYPGNLIRSTQAISLTYPNRDSSRWPIEDVFDVDAAGKIEALTFTDNADPNIADG